MNKKFIRTATVALLLAPFCTTVYAGDASAGLEKSKSCVACHGASGEGVGGKNKIAGLSVGKFKDAMAAYKTGTRKHAMMQMFAAKLSDADVADLAAFYAGK